MGVDWPAVALLGVIVVWDVARRFFATKGVPNESLAADLAEIGGKVAGLTDTVDKVQEVAKKAQASAQKQEWKGLSGRERRR